MEHHWDEAYGYFTDAVDYAPNGNGTNRFWGKYANSREGVLQSATKISQAFRIGRAWRSAWTSSPYVISKLQSSMRNYGKARCWHGDSLPQRCGERFWRRRPPQPRAFQSRKGLHSSTAVHRWHVGSEFKWEHLLEDLGEDYYNASLASINQVRDELAALTGLTDVADQLWPGCHGRIQR